MIEDIKKGQLDLVQIISTLDTAIERLNGKVEYYQDTKVTSGMVPLYTEKMEIAVACKENLEYVLDVIDNKVDKQQLQAANISNYKPRKIVYLSEIGSYRTEVIKLKKSFDTLFWAARRTSDKEKKEIFEECIQKLNDVYSNIASLNRAI